MTNQQLYLAIGIPAFLNAAMFGLLIAYMNSRFDAVNSRFETISHGFETISHGFDAIDRRFDAIDRRFDDMRDLWRSELRRVEEVLDARLKHLEER